MVTVTNAAKAKQTTAYGWRIPSRGRAAAAARPAAPGTMKFRRRLSAEERRQASSGPTPVMSRSASPSGTFTRLKNGAPTVICSPCTASERTGNSVPQRTEKQAASSRRLLNRNPDSRETTACSSFSVFRSFSRVSSSAAESAAATTRNTRNRQANSDEANACTDETMPLRVRKVPKTQSR